jgi:ribonuclease BN (tRNA processing enzyme)
LIEKLTEAWPWLSPKNYERNLIELAPGTFTAHGLEITAIPIRHTAQSLGYRLRSEDGLLALSGDADTCDELVELARDADVFVCDSATPDDLKIEGHLTPGLAAGYAERAGARELVLTHFYPECEGHDLLAEARAHFGGKVTLAADLMRMPVSGD